MSKNPSSNWIPVTTENIIKYIAHGECSGPVDSVKVAKLAASYHFVDFTSFNQAHPVISVLQNGNLKTNFNNPYYHHNYGYKNPPALTFPLIDHAYYFRAQGRAYLVCSTYLKRNDILEKISDVQASDRRMYGDYSCLCCDILEGEEAYYTGTCTVILYCDPQRS